MRELEKELADLNLDSVEPGAEKIMEEGSHKLEIKQEGSHELETKREGSYTPKIKREGSPATKNSK